MDSNFLTCPNSLSNLSFDDEDKITSDSLTKDMRLMSHPSEDHDEIVEGSDMKTVNVAINDNISEDGGSDNDDILLESCINIGMHSASNRVENNPDIFEAKNRSVKANTDNNHSHEMLSTQNVENYSAHQYATEDTPAVFSKAGSETNLSILSIDTHKNAAILSDDSSNTSDAGNDRLLEECIRDGLPKPSSSKHIAQYQNTQPHAPSYNLPQTVYKENPINMMRSGSSGLAPYTPSNDEMNKFMVEDSPCNFSVASGLSDITVSTGVARLAQIKRYMIKIIFSAEFFFITFPFYFKVASKTKTIRCSSL